MAFISAAAGLLGSLFSHHSSGILGGSSTGQDGLLAEDMRMVEESKKQYLENSIKSAKNFEEVTEMEAQASRTQIRAGGLAGITSRHEGLMQSIQQAESAHVKSSFDLIKQS